MSPTESSSLAREEFQDGWMTRLLSLPRMRHRVGDLTIKSLIRVLGQPAVARRMYRDIIVDGYPSSELDFLSFCRTHRELGSGQLLQDLWVLFETEMQRGGYFVEFGAADGVVHSNTLRLEADMGWSGLLAEPNPDFERALRRNRRASIETRCVWHTSGVVVDFLVADDPELSGVVAETANGEQQVAEPANGLRKIRTVSLGDMLEEHQCPAVIDYLSIDTEGSELAILSAFDFSQYDIRLVSVEHNYRDDRDRIDDLMLGNGFERRFPALSGCDYWYRKEL